MREIALENTEAGISAEQIEDAVRQLQTEYPAVKKVLVLPPDYTRCFSYAGEITQMIYRIFSAAGAEVFVMPALGTHMEMNMEEKEKFFAGVVPDSAFLVHRWQSDTIRLGTIPADFVSEITEGLFREEIAVEMNHALTEGEYDLILSVGQVVPHEVVGMSNYSKNLFVGVGGRDMINYSHMVGAICGLEQVIGVTDSPTRKLYDYAQQHYVDGRIPVVFLLTVTTQPEERVRVNGLYIGASREPYERACDLSQKLNITHFKERVKKVVCYLDPDECKSTWIGNKAIYRSCKMIADGGELIVLAPNVSMFGENEEADALIREYGYCGREEILSLYRQGKFEGMEMVAAHLIHGSSNGRYRICYATDPEKLSREEVEKVGFLWSEYREAAARYLKDGQKDGFHRTEDGEVYYYISKPAAGLWQTD